MPDTTKKKFWRQLSLYYIIIKHALHAAHSARRESISSQTHSNALRSRAGLVTAQELCESRGGRPAGAGLIERLERHLRRPKRWL